MKYVNPENRKQIYVRLREFHYNVYDIRVQLLEEFKTLPINRLNGTVVSGLVEKVRNAYSDTEEKFNKFVEELKTEHEEAHKLALERLDKVW